jgi:tRNA pseudouridine55 synthase
MNDGFLVVDKPAGITSHDAVKRIRKTFDTRRVGHAGTLDPMATGVLVIGVGAATRLLQFIESTSKRYDASVSFGARTDSLDATGEVVERADASGVTRERLEATLASFTGEIEQLPPMVSALKVDGERLHAKARRGETVERTPRRVTIHELRCVGFETGSEPVAQLELLCSSGTYVRTLADDLGVALGTFAHLTALRRTAVGEATVDGAVALDDVDATHLRGVIETLAHLPRRELDDTQDDWIRHGRRIEPAGFDGPYLGVHDDHLVAILRDDTDVTRIEVGLPEPLR